MHQELVEKYVKLIVRSGANVQAGQGVTIRISPELADFGRMLVKEAYEAGAAWVRVDWEDQAITKLAYEYQSTDELATVKKWEEERLKYSAETLPARIFITSADPDGLKGMDQAKLSEVSRRQYPVLKPYHDAMENKYQWVIAGAPSVAWAKKIFPDLSEAEAVDNLWAAIFDTSRVSLEEDPLETWQRHNESFEARMKWLNDHTFSKIH
ncbi:MAG: aminopeptidase, partial [Clostridiaceae bacterium]|nr:aminopeptidase [Clostridiaceae bacterium]